jgi:hypothetical protein
MGEDPEYGASLNYWLRNEAASAPTIEILDASGTIVRTLRGPNARGVNRIHWDLRDEPNEPIVLLTSPMYAEHIEVGEDGRPAPGGARISILMPPGRYTVRLTVDGRTHEQPLTVLKDPHSAGTEADIAAQVAFVRAVRDDVVEAGEAVERVESMRVQLAAIVRFLDDDSLKADIHEVQQKLIDIQMNMVDLRLTGQGQDGVRFEARLLQKLGYLTNAITNADFGPTDQESEVRALLHAQLLEHMDTVERLVREEVAPLNERLRARGVIITAN